MPAGIILKMVNKIYNIERIPTGIPDFDLLTDGGFKKNSTNLLVGGSGCGKTIFCIQFLVEGCKQGEKVLYVTFEEKKSEIYSNMGEFGINLQELEEQGFFYFLEYTPEKIKTMLEEGGGAIENIVLTKKISRIVIDSVTSFELLFEREIEKRETALELFSLIRKWNCTSLLTYEGNAAAEEKSTSRVMDFESDSIILLYLIRNGNQRHRFLEIMKMRGTKHSLDVHHYTIGEKGILVNKQPYSGELGQGISF
jgi:circadian clock protein KaiC